MTSSEDNVRGSRWCLNNSPLNKPYLRLDIVWGGVVNCIDPNTQSRKNEKQVGLAGILTQNLTYFVQLAKYYQLAAITTKTNATTTTATTAIIIRLMQMIMMLTTNNHTR